MALSGSHTFKNITELLIVTDSVSTSTSGTLVKLHSENKALLLEPYFRISAPSILLSIVTITLNTFVIDYYRMRRNQLAVVPLIYTMISLSDILTAVGVIYQSISTSLFHLRVIEMWVDVDKYHAVISYTLIAVSYRSSIFNNLILAVYRTVVILRPFHQKNNILVIAASAAYCAIWLLIAVIDIHLSFQTAGAKLGHGFGYKTYIEATTMGKDIEDIFDSDACLRNVEMVTNHDASKIAMCNSKLYAILETLFRIAFTVVPFLVPVLIVSVTCIIQVIALYRTDHSPISNEQRHATITVFLMSVLFIGCNSAYTIYIFLLKFNVLWDPRIMTMAILGTVLPILNAALNPVIIISRCSGLRGMFVEKSLMIFLNMRRAVRRAYDGVELRVRSQVTQGSNEN
ncbi:hypothetical protein ACHWQZ_G006306 [Mnemiopsis leidyi]